MPFKEALFWVGLTVFGTGLFFVVEGDRVKMGWSIGITLLGFLALGYSIYSYHNPTTPKIPVWAYLLLLTWVFIGFDYYDRHQNLSVGNQYFDQSPITSENLEANIRKWLDDFQFSVTKKDDSNAYFVFDVVMPNGSGITIVRAKKLDKYLALGATISIDPEQMDRYGHLTEHQKEELRGDVTMDLVRARFSFNNQLPRFVAVADNIPITPNLTEYDLIKEIDAMGDAILLARGSFLMNLERMSPSPAKR